MRNIIFLLFVLAVHAFSAVIVESLDSQISTNNLANMRIRIFSSENRTLKNIHLRYYFHNDKRKSFRVEAYYVSNARLSFREVNDSLAFFELFIDSIPKGYYPNNDGFNVALHHVDWSMWDKTEDYSYMESEIFKGNDKISLYEGNSLVYGKPIIFNSLKKNIKIIGFQSAENAWLEIGNTGNFVESTENISLMNEDSVIFELPLKVLNPGDKICIGKNENTCFNYAEKIIKPEIWNEKNNGELLLKYKDHVISYIAWGNSGSHAYEAVKAGIWNDISDFLPNKKTKKINDVQFVENAFFRMIKNRKGDKIEDWLHFSDLDDPNSARIGPKPIKLTMNRPVIERLPGDKKAYFSWVPVENVSKYFFVLYDSVGVKAEIKTAETFVVLDIENGKIGWDVYCGADSVSGLENDKDFQQEIRDPITGEILFPALTALQYLLKEAKVDTSIHNELYVESIKARKDTRMLNLGYLNLSKSFGWDKVHIDDLTSDMYSINRCWAVSVEVLNHFYGGNLTQDEIVFGTRFKESDRLFSDANYSGAIYRPFYDETKYALEFALNPNDGNHQIIVERHNETPTYSFVKNEIDNHRLVFVGYNEDEMVDGAYPGHAMVIYGCVGNENNYAYLYAFGDNDGHKWNSLGLTHELTAYYTITGIVNNDVRMSDPLVRFDSDSDGILDFDEVYRFETNPFDYDSDGDGVSDKQEIYKYINVSRITGFSDRYFDIKNEISDRNKNKVRAELDFDDNGDGLNDGLYDSRYKNTIDDIPQSYTLYARDHLYINDGVSCYDETLENGAYCKVGGDGNHIFSYDPSLMGVSLGARAHVGYVYVNNCNNSIVDSSVFLRNGSVVHEDVGVYVGRNLSDNYIVKQNGATVLGKTVNLDSQSCNSYGLPSFYKNDNMVDKVVKSGESFYLRHLDKFNKLIVENGGTLFIENGEMYVDSLLQVEPNARIIFTKPGYKSVLHLNGRILWKIHDNESFDNSYEIQVAKGFKLIQHSSKKMYIEGDWAGTIYAPLSELILGQTSKIIYGRFLGKDVVVHQYAKVYRVDFSPIEDSGTLVLR